MPFEIAKALVSFFCFFDWGKRRGRLLWGEWGCFKMLSPPPSFLPDVSGLFLFEVVMAVGMFVMKVGSHFAPTLCRCMCFETAADFHRGVCLGAGQPP